MKPAFWIWLLTAPVLTGAAIAVLVVIPSLAPALGQWIVGAAAASALVALPVSFAIGKAIA